MYRFPGTPVRSEIGRIAAVAGVGVALAWVVNLGPLPAGAGWLALGLLLGRQRKRTVYWRGSASWWRRHAGALLDDREDQGRA